MTMTYDDALAVVQSRLEAVEDVDEEVWEAIDALHRLVAAVAEDTEKGGWDQEAVDAIVAAAEWQGEILNGSDLADTAYAEGIADAIGWACDSCRDDVGWAKNEDLERLTDGRILVAIECGHCGSTHEYDAATGEGVIPDHIHA